MEDSDAGRAAEIAKARVEIEALKAQNERLEKRYADLDESSRKKSLHSHGLWSRKIRETNSELLTIFRAWLDKMRRYVVDETRVQPDIMVLNQATTLLDSYSSLAEIGIEVLSELVEKCRSDVELFTRKIEGENVVTRDELDLDFKSLEDLVADMDRGTLVQYPQP